MCIFRELCYEKMSTFMELTLIIQNMINAMKVILIILYQISAIACMNILEREITTL